MAYQTGCCLHELSSLADALQWIVPCCAHGLCLPDSLNFQLYMYRHRAKAYACMYICRMYMYIHITHVHIDAQAKSDCNCLCKHAVS